METEKNTKIQVDKIENSNERALNYIKKTEEMRSKSLVVSKNNNNV